MAVGKLAVGGKPKTCCFPLSALANVTSRLVGCGVKETPKRKREPVPLSPLSSLRRMTSVVKSMARSWFASFGSVFVFIGTPGDYIRGPYLGARQ
jgi:hypothetical protein